MIQTRNNWLVVLIRTTNLIGHYACHGIKTGKFTHPLDIMIFFPRICFTFTELHVTWGGGGVNSVLIQFELKY